MSKFDEDYYMRGVETGVSNYENYTWMPEQTIRCCEQMAKHLHMQPGDSVLDYGCARGYYVRALRELGYEADGYDVSDWAIENCDPSVQEFVSSRTLPRDRYDWVIAKDVLEHIPRSELPNRLRKLMSVAQMGILIIVPLSNGSSYMYVNPKDNADETHEICWTLESWLSFCQHHIDKGGFNYTVSAGYRIPGVKDAAAEFKNSTGFITLRRYL